MANKMRKKSGADRWATKMTVTDLALMRYKCRIINLNTRVVSDELRRNNSTSNDEIFKSVSSYCCQNLLFPGEKIFVFEFDCNKFTHRLHQLNWWRSCGVKDKRTGLIFIRRQVSCKRNWHLRWRRIEGSHGRYGSDTISEIEEKRISVFYYIVNEST